MHYAHTPGAGGAAEPLSRHLAEVASLAEEFAQAFGEGQRAYVAGLLHDLGKYGDLFQRRLAGQERGIDHWSAGAWAALTKYREQGAAIALAVAGHHAGLSQWCKAELRKLDPAAPRPAEAPRPSEPRVELLLSRLAGDGLDLPGQIGESPPAGTDPVVRMSEARMLFSALVDADYLATEEHFEPGRRQLRKAALQLDAAALAAKLAAHLAAVRAGAAAAPAVTSLRDDLSAACARAAAMPPGLYTLTAPTGAGKTLALLRFALEHALQHGLRRLVVVLPFLSIIDQTAAVYRAALAGNAGHEDARLLVLEDHCLAEAEPEKDDLAEVASARRRTLLAENWDAPIVVTTSVQFLESLFSNSPAACRKLHRLAKSVLIFDEVQTLPMRLAIPTLAAVSNLAAHYGATVVFSTATQPAFDHLDEPVGRLGNASNWRPVEIAPDSLNLYARAQRVEAEWPAAGERVSLADLAGRLAHLRQALCIVNVKRDARELFGLLEPERGEELFHLSTDMCPQHRRAALDAIQGRLAAGKPCILAATQCVEAGVDLDFPVVYRALAPLDAIAQAAGRCNRNGRLTSGRLRIFCPADARYPSPDYRQAALLTAEMLAEGRGCLNLDDPQVFRAYYRRLYSLATIEEQSPELLEAVKALNFVEVRRRYHVIENADSINLLAAYDRARYEQLAADVRQNGLSRKWIAAARPLAVAHFRPRGARGIRDYLEPVRLRDGSQAPDWFIHLRPEHYHRKLGLQVPEEMEFMAV